MIAAVVLALGLLCQWRIGFNNDNAWLLYIARRSLAGQVLYRDLIEINPPALIWLDQAVVIAARAFHTDPLTMFRLVTGALSVAVAWWSARIVRGSLAPGSGRFASAALVFVLVLLPVGWFGQREHFVLLLLLPLLATAVAREHGRVGRSTAVISGALAGLGFGIKPHYLLVWLLLLAFQARSRRSWRALVAPEHVAVVLCGAVYLVLVLALAPEYLPMLHRLAGLYAEYRRASLPRLVAGDFAALVVLLALTMLVVYRRLLPRHPALHVLLLATVGFYLGVLLQGKGFDYHYYPALATGLLLLALGAVSLDGAAPGGRRARVAMVALALIGATPYALAALRIGLLGDDPEMRAYRALERTVGPIGGEPILVLSGRSGYAFGLVTYAGAEWVGPFPCLWVPGVLREQRARGREGREAMALETWFRDGVIRAAEQARPRAILVSPPGHLNAPADLRVDLLAYFSSDARFQKLMEGYRADGEAAGYRIYRRRITAVESRYQVVQP